MKPDRIILDEADKMEVVQQIPDESKKFVGSIVPYKGHTLFEINCTNGNIVSAKYEDVTVGYEGGKVTRKVLVNPNCLYISCLNKKAAQRKFGQWLIQKSIEKHKSHKI